MATQRETIGRVEAFVAREFKKHPHYSFDDWTVMHQHSVTVKDLALKICEDLAVDNDIVAIGALLHDIGKTHVADADTLHAHHEDFNLLVAEQILNSLGLTDFQLHKLRRILAHDSDTLEMQVIEDADALAMYSDKRLYTLFITWARNNNLDQAIQRKLDKFDKLHFEQSRRLGEEWYRQMRIDWGL